MKHLGMFGIINWREFEFSIQYNGKNEIFEVEIYPLFAWHIDAYCQEYFGTNHFRKFIHNLKKDKGSEDTSLQSCQGLSYRAIICSRTL